MTENKIVTQEETKENEMYPHPYKVKNNCLYVEKSDKNGIYDRKLCNFIAWVVSEITIDSGTEEKKHLVICGQHENGNKLKKIEIAGSELANFSWLMEYWGIDCVLEPCYSVKEHLRYAIQSTAVNADKQTKYMVTGWKKINDEWHYLMPGDTGLTVKLTGKLSRYEMPHSFSQSSVELAWSMFQSPLIPKEILYTMFAYTFLTPLNEFLHKVNHEPKFVLMLLGKTGARKSTLSALFLSFFGRFTSSDLPLSFRDTANNIMHQTAILKDVLTCIDDFHPTSSKEGQQLTQTAQAIMRAYGDRTGRGRLKADSTPMDSVPPKGNAIITAEFAPDIGESGTARYFSLELKTGDVNLSALSNFQDKASKGLLEESMYAYIKMIADLVNDAEDYFTDKLKILFDRYMAEFQEQKIYCHGRVPEIVAWLRIGMYMFLEFVNYHKIISVEKLREIDKEFAEILYLEAKNQAENIQRDKPSYIFITKLFALIESGNAVVVPRSEAKDYQPVNFIGYEDDEFYYLNKSVCHKMVKKLCDEQGENFNITERGLLKALAEEELISTSGNQNTKSVRCGAKTNRFLCLYKSKAQAIYDSSL